MSDPGTDQREIEDLITSHLEGGLDEQGLARLEAWLVADASHQRHFLAAVQVHQALRGRRGGRQAPRLRRRAGRSRYRRISQVLVGAMMAAALVAIALIWWHAAAAPPAQADQLASRTSTAPARGLLRLDQDVGAWTGQAGRWTPAEAGPLIPGSALRTDPGGSARLSIPDGTRLELGPSAMLVTSVAAPGTGTATLALEQGTIEAEVAHQDSATPLRIATPSSVITVVGTHLRVAYAGHETLVAVARGEVRVERSSDHARLDLGAGREAVVPDQGQPLEHASGTPWGRLLEVEPGSAHPTLASLGPLQPGDVVEVAAGTYHEAVRLGISGTPLRPITIRAKAGGAMPWFDGEGLVMSGIGAVPRGLLQLEGGHYRIQGIGCRQAHNHDNACGIRLVDAPDVVISGCSVHDCDDGIAGEGDAVVVDACHLTRCGTLENDGYSHDLYLEAGSSLEVTGCTIDHAIAGQALKCSAHRIRLVGNRIGEAEDGEISFLDLPDGRDDDAIELYGNLVVSLPNRHGNHQRFIAISGEHGGQRLGQLVLAYNTLAALDPRNLIIDLAGSRVALLACDNVRCWAATVSVEGGGVPAWASATGCQWAQLLLQHGSRGALPLRVSSSIPSRGTGVLRQVAR